VACGNSSDGSAGSSHKYNIVVILGDDELGIALEELGVPESSTDRYAVGTSWEPGRSGIDEHLVVADPHCQAGLVGREVQRLNELRHMEV